VLLIFGFLPRLGIFSKFQRFLPLISLLALWIWVSSVFSLLIFGNKTQPRPYEHLRSMCRFMLSLLRFSTCSVSKGLILSSSLEYFGFPPDTLCAQPPELSNLKQFLSTHTPCALNGLYMAVFQHFIWVLDWCSPCTSLPPKYSKNMSLLEFQLLGPQRSLSLPLLKGI